MTRAFRYLCREYFPQRKLAISGYAVSHIVKLALAFIAPSFIIKNLIDVVLPKGDVKLLILYTLFFLAAKVSLMGAGFVAVFLANKLKYGFDHYWKSSFCQRSSVRLLPPFQGKLPVTLPSVLKKTSNRFLSLSSLIFWISY